MDISLETAAGREKTQSLVARIHHNANEYRIAFHSSIADRLFIAMLLSDAPMPNCDMLVPAGGVLWRAGCVASKLHPRNGVVRAQFDGEARCAQRRTDRVFEELHDHR